jgi:rare lipoprotein A (peptidoglycan hydrolase)
MRILTLQWTFRSCTTGLMALCISAYPQNGAGNRTSQNAGEKKHSQSPLNKSAQKAPSGLRGFASWYGSFHQGMETASGEPFDMNKLTAAHRTLPLGTIVMVRNLTNGRTVQLRINDRGPYPDLNAPPHPYQAEHCGRVMDLSMAAGSALKMIGHGVVPIEITVVQLPPIRAAKRNPSPAKLSAHAVPKPTAAAAQLD